MCIIQTRCLAGICIISLDRTWAVLSPVSYRSYNSVTKTLIVIAATWVLMNAIILPALIYERTVNADLQKEYECIWNLRSDTLWAGSFYMSVFTEWVPVCLTVVCYLVTITKLKLISCHRERRILPTSQASRRPRNEQQANLLLTLLFAALVMMWGPWFIFQGVEAAVGAFTREFYITTYWFSYSLSAVNPFLFNVANDDIRRVFRQLASKTTAPKSTSQVEPTGAVTITRGVTTGQLESQ